MSIASFASSATLGSVICDTPHVSYEIRKHYEAAAGQRQSRCEVKDGRPGP